MEDFVISNDDRAARDVALGVLAAAGWLDAGPVDDASEVRRDPLGLPLPDPALSDGAMVLRAWDQSDVEVVLAAGLEQLISRYRYSLPRTRDAARRWIIGTEADRLAGRRVELAITEGGVALGSVALAELTHGNAMVRYWLLPDGRGRGLATAAVRLLAGWAFSAAGLDRLGALIEPDNRASAAVLHRCGFVKEGRLRRHMTAWDGSRVDCELYGLLAGDLDS